MSGIVEGGGMNKLVQEVEMRRHKRRVATGRNLTVLNGMEFLRE